MSGGGGPIPAAAGRWPAHGGALGALIRDLDASATLLGAPVGWPAPLRAAVDLMLASPAPMVILWGPRGAMLYNDAYAYIAGGRHPAILGQPVLEMWPEAADLNRRVLRACLAGQTLSIREAHLVLYRNGPPEDVWLDADYSPLFDAGGGPAGVLAVVTEVTGRVLAERRRQEAEQALLAEREAVGAANARLRDETELLRDLLERAPSFMAVVRGPDHRFVLANDAFAALAGGRPLIGRPLREAFAEVEDPEVFAAFDAVHAIGEPVEGRATAVVLRNAQGVLEERRLDLLLQPIRRAGGAAGGIFVSGIDVTVRLASEERLRIAQRAGEIGAFEWFPDTDRMEVSDEYRRIWGFPPRGEITGQMAYDAVLPEDHALTGQQRLGRVANALAYSEYRVRRPDTGEIRWIARRGQVIETDPRAPLRYIGVAFDITARKQVEAQLQALNATLEERVAREVAERTRAEAALRQAQKMETVGQLTGGIAHDFNNLLQGIIGSLDLVESRLAAGRMDDIDRFLEGAMGSARRAAALTHRLLAFSRRQPLDPRPVEINPFVAAMEDLLRRTLGETIALTFDLAEGLWRTRCDPHQLENAVLNLAINARDAMPEGGRLTIKTRNLALHDAVEAAAAAVEAGDYVCLSVSDDGLGMAPDVVERAFEPFFTTKPIGQGSGLGLSMIYGFARQSQGYAQIESVVGAGTTIRLLLPRADDASAAGAEVAEPPVAERPATPTKPGRALVVEDNAVVRALVVEVLQAHGHQVSEAVDGTAGLAAVASAEAIDLLVTDIGLPGLDGRRLARAARARHPDLKVLFMTGYADVATRAEGFLEPGMAMITKPFSLEALARRLAELAAGG